MLRALEPASACRAGRALGWRVGGQAAPRLGGDDAHCEVRGWIASAPLSHSAAAKVNAAARVPVAERSLGSH
jgi:hypothetical protein